MSLLSSLPLLPLLVHSPLPLLLPFTLIRLTPSRTSFLLYLSSLLPPPLSLSPSSLYLYTPYPPPLSPFLPLLLPLTPLPSLFLPLLLPLTPHSPLFPLSPLLPSPFSPLLLSLSLSLLYHTSSFLSLITPSPPLCLFTPPPLPSFSLSLIAPPPLSPFSHLLLSLNPLHSL